MFSQNRSEELVKFAEIQLPQDLEPEQVQAYQLSKGQLQQAIENRRQHIEQLKAQRKAVAKHGGHGTVVSSNLINRRRTNPGLQSCEDGRLQDVNDRFLADQFESGAPPIDDYF